MDRNKELVWWDEILAIRRVTMSDANPDFKFKYGDKVWRKDKNPFVMGIMLASYRDPDSGTIYCLIKSNSKNIFVCPEGALDFTKDAPQLRGPVGVDQIDDRK